MAITQGKSKKSASGARMTSARKKRLHEHGSIPMMTKLGVKQLKTTRTAGGNMKVKTAANDFANLTDSKTKKKYKAKIESVLENSANRNFVRRNILTKGTIIKTDKGKAKITSRPGQEGTINAVLIE